KTIQPNCCYLNHGAVESRLLEWLLQNDSKGRPTDNHRNQTLDYPLMAAAPQESLLLTQWLSKKYNAAHLTPAHRQRLVSDTPLNRPYNCHNDLARGAHPLVTASPQTTHLKRTSCPPDGLRLRCSCPSNLSLLFAPKVFLIQVHCPQKHGDQRAQPLRQFAQRASAIVYESACGNHGLRRNGKYKPYPLDQAPAPAGCLRVNSPYAPKSPVQYRVPIRQAASV